MISCFPHWSFYKHPNLGIQVVDFQAHQRSADDGSCLSDWSSKKRGIQGEDMMRWWYLTITHLKFNMATEKFPSQNIFRGHVKVQVGVLMLQRIGVAISSKLQVCATHPTTPTAGVFSWSFVLEVFGRWRLKMLGKIAWIKTFLIVTTYFPKSLDSLRSTLCWIFIEAITMKAQTFESSWSIGWGNWKVFWEWNSSLNIATFFNILDQLFL